VGYNAGRLALIDTPSAEIKKEVIKLIYDSVFLKGIHSLWFLPTIFIGEIVFYFLLRCPKAIQILYAIAGVFSITFFKHFLGWLNAHASHSSIVYEAFSRWAYAVGKGLLATWFLGAGYIIYTFYKRLDNIKIKLGLGILLTAVNIPLSQLNDHVDINTLKEGTVIPLFYICGIIGSMGAIFLLDAITQYVSLKGLSYWGKNSLIVMCTHTALGFKAVIFLGWRRYVYIPKHYDTNYLWACFFVLLQLMLLTAGVIQFVNSYCPFLIGKKREEIKKTD
jgi:hypothetical protein